MACVVFVLLLWNGVFSISDVFPFRYQAIENVVSRMGYPAISHSRPCISDRLLSRWRATAHVCLNTNTKGNVVNVGRGETVVDEGEDSNIAYEEKHA